MATLPQLLVLCVPLVLAGILNMIFVKIPLLNHLKTPMDGGKTWGDGKRWFGDNKTWKGFWGMTLFTGLMQGLLEGATSLSPSVANLVIIPFGQSFFHSGVGSGLLVGLAYVLAELPNSFIKRRIDIAPGTNLPGFVGKLFLVIDQADSSIGSGLVFMVICNLSPMETALLILCGTVVHYIVNLFLFVVKLKNQAG